MGKTHTIKLHLWKVYLGIDQQKSEKNNVKNDRAKLQKKLRKGENNKILTTFREN